MKDKRTDNDVNALRDSFAFRRDWYTAISKRSDKVRLEIYDAIMSECFGDGDVKLSEVASIVMDFIFPQIQQDKEKWMDIRDKRRKAGSKHVGNQYNSKVEEGEENGTSVPKMEQNGTKWNKMEQNGTNGTSVPIPLYNINNNNNIDNITGDIIGDKEEVEIEKKEEEDNKLSPSKKDKKEEEDEFVERMYKLYPTKCPLRNTTLGKCKKDKDRIRRLLKTYSMEDIERVIRKEVEEKYGRHYLANFSTFLNNFPDPASLFEEEQPQNTEMPTPNQEEMVLNGQVYR